MYTSQEVMEYVEQEDVKFIRLAFCDIFGNQKNISIMPSQLYNAFERGIAFEASAIKGFGDGGEVSLLLFPDPDTLSVLPWRPTHGRVIRLYCDIKYPDGRPFPLDGRNILKNAVKRVREKGVFCRFGGGLEFYLFKTDEDGEPTDIPYDRAGYMDIAPEDRGENVRREVCLTLEEMGILSEGSHHERGPGQHRIEIAARTPLAAADDMTTFKSVVKTVASRNGLFASFAPRPVIEENGSCFHIRVFAENMENLEGFKRGIVKYLPYVCPILNPLEESYIRINEMTGYLKVNDGAGPAVDIYSPDPMANPYLTYALLLEMGVHGIEEGLGGEPGINISSAGEVGGILMPGSIGKARELARNCDIIKNVLPEKILGAYSLL